MSAVLGPEFSYLIYISDIIMYDNSHALKCEWKNISNVYTHTHSCTHMCTHMYALENTQIYVNYLYIHNFS